MYGNGFVEMLKAGAVREPRWIASTVTWSANVFQAHQLPLNTAFALVQIAIGLGILHRRTVKPALALSLVWAVVVWWPRESFKLARPPPSATSDAGAWSLPLVGTCLASERPGGLRGDRARG